jgi:hypothetical protein
MVWISPEKKSRDFSSEDLWKEIERKSFRWVELIEKKKRIFKRI